MRKGRRSAGRALEAKRTGTAHRLAEEARGQLTREWQATFDAIEDLVVVIDKAHRVVRANRAMHEAFGGMTVLGAHCYELFHGTKEPLATCPVSQTFRTGQPTRCELCEQHLGGRWFDISAWPVTGDAGTGQQVVHVIRDVTERQRVEAALRESLRNYRTLLENLPQNIFLKDRSSVYLSCNEHYAGDLGITPAEIVGKTDYDFYPKQLAEQYRADDKRVMESGVPEDIDEPYIQEGKEVWIHTVKTPVREDNGEVVGVLGIFWDVSESKRAEEERRRGAERLEVLNRELERSNRDFEEFTQTVSHDLQEPLRKIRTFGAFLAEDLGEELPESAREHLRRMQDAAVRMQGLIEHLLGLARVGTEGRRPIEVAAGMVIEKVRETLSERVRESGAEITVAAELPWVMADPVQLEQVFQNLLSNALKFRSVDRAPRITISATGEGEQVRFAVSDNGIGIEERFFERIFGVFQRLHPREQYEGAGVGLALCAKIVRRHGGRIWVESEVGKGSTFCFTLPALRPG